jgi:hypothetical protein
MINPWTQISSSNKILDIDKDVIESFNKQYQSKSGNDDRTVSLIDYPEPFIGDPNAKIYILLANPGRNIREEDCNVKLIKKNGLENNILSNLCHNVENLKYPFYFLDPIFSKHTGAKWWVNAFCKLINGNKQRRKNIANSMFGVELYGYHTQKFEKALTEGKKLASSEYSYYLVEKAIEEKKIILMPRAVGKWFEKVPKLKEYYNCHIVASNRGINFSDRTISPKPFKEIQKIIN